MAYDPREKYGKWLRGAATNAAPTNSTSTSNQGRPSGGGYDPLQKYSQWLKPGTGFRPHPRPQPVYTPYSEVEDSFNRMEQMRKNMEAVRSTPNFGDTRATTRTKFLYDQAAATYAEKYKNWRLGIRKEDEIQKELDAISAQLDPLEKANSSRKRKEKADSFFRMTGGYLSDHEMTKEDDPALAPLREKKRILEEELGYSKYFGYDALTRNQDFAEKSKYKKPELKWNGIKDNNYYDSTLYDAVNRDKAALYELHSNGDEWDYALPTMTDEEIGIYNYLHSSDPEKAMGYLEYLKKDINARKRMANERRAAEFASEHPVIATAGSVLTSPIKGSAYLRQGIDYLRDGEIDPNASYNDLIHTSGAAIGQVSSDIENTEIRDTAKWMQAHNIRGGRILEAIGGNKKWGKPGSFAYETGVSMSEFLLNTAITGGNQALTLAIMGTGAAADTTVSALDRGISSGKAFALGGLAGAAEVVTEKISLETLLNPELLRDGTLKYVVKNTLAEGSEELASDVFNLIADTAISRDKAEWRQAIETYMQNHPRATREEAESKVWNDQLKQMALDFAGGAVSGGVMAGAGAGINNVQLAEQGKQRIAQWGDAQQEYYGVNNLINAGLAANDPVAQRAAYRLMDQQSKGKITNLGVGRALDANTRYYAPQIQRALDEAKAKIEAEDKKALEKESREFGTHAQAMAATWIPGQSVEGYSKSFKLAYTMGKTGVSEDAALQSESLDGLTDKQKHIAWRIGATAAQQQKANEEAPSFEVSEDKAGTFRISDGKAIGDMTISEVKDGDIFFETDKGEIVNAKDISFKNENEAILYHAIAETGMDAETANSVMESYDPEETSLTAGEYAEGLRNAFEMGQKRYPMADVKRGLFSGKLPSNVQQAVYQQGYNSSQRTAPKLSGKSYTPGSVNISGVNTDKGKWTRMQSKSVEHLEQIAKATGIDFVLFESYWSDGQRVYKDPDTGKVVRAEDGSAAPNGFFNPENGKVYIDLNAGNDFSGTILMTAGHELTHAIKEGSAAHYEALADLIKAEYEKKGKSFSDAVREKMLKQKIGKELAEEEVIADSMQSILTDGDIVQFMADVRAKDKGLWNRIKKFFRELAAQIKEIADLHRGKPADTAEGKFVQEMDELREKLKPIFAEGAMEAGANLQERTVSKKETIAQATAKDSLAVAKNATTTEDSSVVEEMAEESVAVKATAEKAEEQETKAQEPDLFDILMEMAENPYERSDDPGNFGIAESEYPQNLKLTNNERKIVDDMHRASVGDKRRETKYNSFGLLDSAVLNGEGDRATISKIKSDAEKTIEIASKEIKHFKDTGYRGMSKAESFRRYSELKEALGETVDPEEKAEVLSANAIGEDGIRYWQLMRKDAERNAEKAKILDKLMDRAKFAKEKTDVKFSQRDSADRNLPVSSLTLNDYGIGELRNIASQLTGTDVSDFSYMDRAELIENIEEFISDMSDKEKAETTVSLPIASKKTTQRITAEEDQSYMKAVESGDTVKAERLLRKAASLAGYSIEASHGTNNKFWQFSMKNRGLHGEVLGVGYYFSDSGEVVGSYGKNVVKAFLKIDRPVSATKLTITPAEWEKFLDYAEANRAKYIDGPWKGNKVYVTDEVKDMRNYGSDTELIKAFADSFAGGNAEAAEAALSMLKDSIGYDGTIIPQGSTTTYIAYTPEQIKSAEPVTYDDSGNVIPLSERFNEKEKDIRYSNRDSTGRELTAEQQKYFADSKIRDKEGNLLAMYHGTTHYGEITKFKKGKTGWLGPGIYFTSRKSDADRYANAMGPGNGTLYSTYLNIKNPLIVKGSDPNKEILFAAYGNDKMFQKRQNAQDNMTSLIKPSDIKKLQAQGYDGILWDYGGSYEVNAFEQNQIKRVDNEKPTESPDIRYSERENTGYHAGDLGKAEYLHTQGSSRGTGHFGTGTYFVGNEAKVKNDEYYGKRPQHAVDFSDYNLFKVRRAKEGYDLHDALRLIDGGSFTQEYIQKYNSHELRLIDRMEELDLVDKYFEEEQEKGLTKTSYEDAKIKAATEFMDKYGIPYDSFDNFAPGEEFEDDSEKKWYYADYLDDTLKEAEQEANDDYRKFYNAVDDLYYLTGMNKGRLNNALQKTLQYIEDTKEDRFDSKNKRDSYATVFMKNMGYDGVDVRGTDLDNTEYGSVIYDVKGDSVLYSQRNEDVLRQNKLLQSQNEQLRKDAVKLRELAKLRKKLTGGRVFSEAEINRIAKDLRDSSGAKTGSTKELARLLTDLYANVFSDGKLTWDKTMEAAESVAAWLEDHTPVKLDPEAQEVLDYLKGKSFHMSESQKAEAASAAGNMQEFRKAIAGTVMTSDKANLSLNKLWDTLHDKHPYWFKESSDTNMPRELLRIINVLKNMEVQENPEYAEYAHQDLLRKIYDGYWDAVTNFEESDPARKQIRKLEGKLTDAQKEIADKAAEVKQMRKDHKEVMRIVDKAWKDAYKDAEKAHRNAIFNLQEEHRAEVREKTNAVAKKYQESRKKNVAGRKKTELRSKIKRTVKDLRKILNRGSKKRNVKQGMQDFARLALQTADIIAEGDLTDSAVLDSGSFDWVSSDISKQIEQARNLTEQINELPSELSEEQKKLQDKLARQRAKIMKELAPTIAEERRHMNITYKVALKQLADAYKELQNSPDPYISETYREEVQERLSGLALDADGTALHDMSEEQLRELYDAYKMVLKTVRDANTLFRNGKAESREAIVKATYSQLNENPMQKNDYPDFIQKNVDRLREYTWNMLAPVDAFQRLGSQAFTGLFWDAITAQGKAGTLSDQAKNFIVNARKECNYSKMDFRKSTPFTLQDGKVFRLNLQDMMSIYAYTKRDQAAEHMAKGGFVFDTGHTYKKKKNGVAYRTHKLTEPYKLSLQDQDKILTEFMKNTDAVKYVDMVQKYVTDFGSKYGNETSNILYGIDLFKEKHYIPLKSQHDYLSSTQTELQSTATTSSLTNIGMTKEVKPHATNPIILQGFDGLMIQHLDQMIKYCSYAVPVENLRKVFEAHTSPENGNESIRATISAIYGEEAVRYIQQYITDLNGTKTMTGPKNPLIKLFSRAKKVQVLVNNAVTIQQYSAIVRSMAEINPIYFHTSSKTKAVDMRAYEEMRKYAPIAIIKEMGGFDISSNRGLESWIGEEGAPLSVKKVSEGIDELFGKGPEYMDRAGWLTIWKAVKNEIAKQTNLQPGTEEYLKRCGTRFEEVIVKTQVYDSVNSRSGFMRSQNDSMKFMTAFMGEPTRVVGMIFTASNDLWRAVAARKNIKLYTAKAMRVYSAVALSVVLNDMLKSLAYAMRDDDDDESYWEKWGRRFGDSLRSDMIPSNYLPGFRDVQSAIEGWTVERPDMTLISDLISNVKRVYKMEQKLDKIIEDGGEITEEDRKKQHESWLRLAGDLGNITGIPVKNLIREAKSMFNLVKMATDDVHTHSVPDAIARGFKNDSFNRADEMYDAYVSGDKEYADELYSRYDDPEKADRELASHLAENDPRAEQAAKAKREGRISEYRKVLNDMEKDGVFSKDVILSAIGKAENKLAKNDPEEKEVFKAEFDGRDVGPEDLYNAIVSGTSADRKEATKELQDWYRKKGYTDSEANDSIASSVTSQVKSRYLSESLTAAQARAILKPYGTDGKIPEWDFEAEKGYGWSDREKAFRRHLKGYKNGLPEAELRKWLKTIDADKAAEDPNYINDIIEDYKFTASHGYRKDDIKNLYVAGDNRISEDQISDYVWEHNKSLTEKDYPYYREAIDWEKKYGIKGATGAAVKDYYENHLEKSVEPADWINARKIYNDDSIQGDPDPRRPGKYIKNSKAKKVIAKIKQDFSYLSYDQLFAICDAFYGKDTVYKFLN